MSRRIAYVLPILVGLALSVTVLVALHLEDERYLQESRLDVFYKLSTIQSDFESGVNTRLTLADAIKSFILINPDLDQASFALLAKGLLAEVGGIRYIELARDDVITHMFPVAEGSKVLGRSLITDFPGEVRELVARAKQARHSLLSPPMAVLEGGEAIVTATPVYVPADNGIGKKYWGMILMLIDTRTLYREAGLAAKAPALEVSLREPALGSAGHLLYGKETVFAMEPVVMHIPIPDGYWQIAAVPMAGWGKSPRRAEILGGGAAAVFGFTALLLLSVHLLVSHLRERETSRQLIQNVKSIILRLDLDGNITFANEYAENFYGYEPGELLGKSVVGTLVPESNLGGRSKGRYIEKLMAQKANHPFNEAINTCKSGEMVWVSWVNDPIKDELGDQTGLLCVGTDITDRKIMEEAVKLKERQYRLLAENVTDIIFGLDADMRYTYITPSDEQLRGFPRHEVLGRPMPDFLSRRSELALIDAVEAMKGNISSPSTPPSTTLELEFACADSSSVWLETRIGLLLNENGDPIGMQGVARDIHDRKLIQDMRDDVDRMTRHDLKTPLSAVVSLPEEIRRRGTIDATQDAMLNTIEAAGQSMLELIDRSLDLYKMETGTYEVAATELDLIHAIDQIKDETQALIREKGINIGIDVQSPSDNGTFPIVAEEALLQAMLSNLLLNAFQASPMDGSVTITLDRQDAVTIKLRNVGEVPQEVRESFFEKYATSKKNGSGLGTYSARLMARTLGGDITLDTETPNETCLVITLPDSPRV